MLELLGRRWRLPGDFDYNEHLFKDWQKVEDLIIYDDSLKLEFKKFDRSL
jgi:hypothetical protein